MPLPTHGDGHHVGTVERERFAPGGSGGADGSVRAGRTDLRLPMERPGMARPSAPRAIGVYLHDQFANGRRGRPLRIPGLVSSIVRARADTLRLGMATPGMRRGTAPTECRAFAHRACRVRVD